ncbi:MATE family efflux transporter [Mycoplasmatota bacterium]|nr:MATE family efflux transporter [Mycoplasmatota bacterium]
MTKDEKKSHIILKDKKIYRGIFLLSVPLMFNNVLKSLHDIVDMYFVRNLGTGSVSSISITWSMIFMFLAFSFGLGAAGTTFVSQYLGANNKKMAKHTAGQLLILAILLGIIFNLVLYFLGPYLLVWSGAEGNVLENASSYLRIRSFEMLPLFVFVVYTSIRQSSGDTISPVILNIIAVILNTILSPIFIAVLGFGVAGAAYATIIANYIIFPVSLHYLFFAKTGVKISLTDVIPNKKMIYEIFKIAIPSSLANTITSIGFMIINSIIIREFGKVTFDAFGVGNRINSLTLLPVISIGTVLSTYIGQNVGSRQPERAKLVFKKSVIFTLLFVSLGMALILPFRESIIRVFLVNPDSVKLCKEYILYLTLTLPFFAIFQLLLGLFRGLGNVRYLLILSLTRLWGLRLPMITILVYIFSFRESGVWHAMWVSNIFAVLIGSYLFKRTKFKARI